MDEKMRKEIGTPLKKAKKLIKKATSSTYRLADFDERVRDPMLRAYKKLKKRCPVGKRK